MRPLAAWVGVRRVVPDLVIIGLAITLEPVTIVAFILIFGAEKGIRKGLAFILGWMACLVAMIASVVPGTRGKPPAPHTVLSSAVLAIKAALGIVLIAVAYRQWRRKGRPHKQPTWMARLDPLSPGPCGSCVRRQSGQLSLRKPMSQNIHS